MMCASFGSSVGASCTKSRPAAFGRLGQAEAVPRQRVRVAPDGDGARRRTEPPHQERRGEQRDEDRWRASGRSVACHSIAGVCVRRRAERVAHGVRRHVPRVVLGEVAAVLPVDGIVLELPRRRVVSAAGVRRQRQHGAREASCCSRRPSPSRRRRRRSRAPCPARGGGASGKRRRSSSPAFMIT